METLRKAADIEFETYPVTVSEVFSQNIPLPFPLMASESELFIGTKISARLGITYSPFETGLAKAYRAFKSVYE